MGRIRDSIDEVTESGEKFWPLVLLVIWGAAQVRSLVTGEGFDHHPVYVAMPITAAAWFFFGFFMEKGWGKAAFIASLANQLPAWRSSYVASTSSLHVRWKLMGGAHQILEEACAPVLEALQQVLCHAA